MSLPSRTLGGGGFGNQFGERERARSARHAPDGLKMNCVQMKSNGTTTDDLKQVALATWAATNLPARLDALATAKLLGFAESDIQVLMAVGKLTPLGDPAPNAPKWFAAVEVIRLAVDQDWLHKATKEIAKYWRYKRERRNSSEASSRKTQHRTIECV